MFRVFMAIWLLGLVTLVPYGIYFLLFDAVREQYAMVGVGVAFWLFGYWAIAGPIISVLRIRRVMSTAAKMRSSHALSELMREEGSTDAAIDFIATENNIPKILAKRVFEMLRQRDE